MSLNLTTANNTAFINALISAVGTNAQIRIYTGSAPTNADTAATGTLLVTLTAGSSAFAGGYTNFLALNPVTSGTAGATGLAGYARILTSGGTVMFDLTSIGTSGADLNLNTTQITAGGTVAIQNGTISFPYP